MRGAGGQRGVGGEKDTPKGSDDSLLRVGLMCDSIEKMTLT